MKPHLSNISEQTIKSWVIWRLAHWLPYFSAPQTTSHKNRAAVSQSELFSGITHHLLEPRSSLTVTYNPRAALIDSRGDVGSHDRKVPPAINIRRTHKHSLHVSTQLE
ncbi:hypothetical protein SMAC4_13699 [Sordaria macrospora]|uniref:uncharacterized protein n=1 Tax=Sordaria macrospora TaxID=5147 RepID=UPI002B314835|nr:hypothetical protein SMAC4_13699 [Sordaria macrospora]